MLAQRWTPRRQGDLGEVSALGWHVEQGAAVFVPAIGSPGVDLIAMYEPSNRIERVQVKTSTARRNDRWEVALCTRGGNQSWNRIVKHLTPDRFDALFVHVGDGRRWCIPAGAVSGGSKLLLGGPKYAKWEIEPGRPLEERPKAEVSAAR